MHCIVMGHTDLAVAPVKKVTHQSINWAHDCLTSLINHEMLTPSLSWQNNLGLCIYQREYKEIYIHHIHLWMQCAFGCLHLLWFYSNQTWHVMWRIILKHEVLRIFCPFSLRDKTNTEASHWSFWSLQPFCMWLQVWMGPFSLGL